MKKLILLLLPFPGIFFATYRNTGWFLERNRSPLSCFTRTILLLVMLSSFGQITYAQDLKAPGKLEFMSPEATELKKYLDFPVSLQNGLTDVTVPLYEIDYFGYKLPLELKYHGGGISSRLFDTYGVNWTFQGGGMISRSVMGVPDELSYFYKSDISALLENDRGYALRYTQRQNNVFVDCEYDEFYVSLPNNSPFKFIINKESGGTCQFLTNPVRNDLKIEMSVTGRNLDSFTITDKSGVKYIFSEIEQCYREGAVPYRNGWKLKKIILPDNNKEINFGYETVQSRRVSYNTSRTISDRGDKDLPPGLWQGTYKDNILPDVEPMEVFYNPTRSETYYYFSILTSVSFGAKNISITYENPTNTNFHYYGSNIASFEVSGMSKKYQFEGHRQDGFFFLDNIKLVSGQNESAYYHFSYNPIYNLSQDPLENCWGYICSGVSSQNRNEMGVYVNVGSPVLYWIPTYTIPHFMVKVEGRSRVYTNWDTPSSQFGFENSASVDPNGVEYVPLGYGDHNHQSGPAGLLNRIDYPTGGYTTFDYEPNTYKRTTDDETNELNYPNGSVAEGGGVRVKTIKKFDQNNALLLEKNYKYGKDECGYGFAPVEETPINFQKSYEDWPERIEPGYGGGYIYNCDTENPQYQHSVADGGGVRCRVREFSIGNFQGLLNGRSPVMYDQVAEYFGHTDDQPNHIGKIVYKYSLFDENGKFPEALEINNMGDPVLTTSHSSRYGQLLEKKIFDSNGNPKSSVNYEYNNDDRWSLAGYINPYFSKMYILNECDWDMHKDVNMFRTNYFTMISGTNNLSREITREYLNNNTVVTEKTYSYKYPYDFISGVDETCSDGTKNSKEYSYAYEMNTEPYLTMKDHNITGPVVEQKQYKNTQLLETNSLDYINWGQNVFKPGSFSKQVNGYAKTVEDVYNYDPETGNLLSVTDKGGITEVYYWGYDNQRNIAKITGLTYSEFNVNTTLKGLLDQLANYTTIDASNRASLINLNNSIRSSLSQGLITTFTYDPLIGMTSQTDPNGVTTYYEYDPFGRLKTTLDNDNNVTKHYKYHYAGESAQGATLTLSSANQSFGTGGGSAPITVNCNASWTVSSDRSWLTVNPSSGSGISSFTITCEENYGADRYGYITVTGGGMSSTLYVYQEAADFYITAASSPHLVGTYTNPLMDASFLSFYYSIPPYSLYYNENVNIQSIPDPEPIGFLIQYNSEYDWLDFYYDEQTRQLTFWATRMPSQTDYAVVNVLSSSLGKWKAFSVKIGY